MESNNQAISLILSDSTITLACKSWIIFKQFGLDNAYIRHKLCNENFQPWLHHAQYPEWKIEGDENVNIYYEMWCKLTFESIYTEIYDTVSMGLGVRAKGNNVTLDNILSDLPGMLEYITQDMWNELVKLQYPSLYMYQDIENGDIDSDITYCILYGPLSLVNHNESSEVGFAHYDNIMNTLLWQMKCECNTITWHEVNFNNTIVDEENFIHNDSSYHLNSQKMSYYGRLIPHYKRRRGKNKKYSRLEEIFIDYGCKDFIAQLT